MIVLTFEPAGHFEPPGRTIMSGKQKLTGVYTAVVTPFDSKQRVDLHWMRAHLAFQRNAGVDGVVVCGTNGEGQSLSAAERRNIVEFTCQSRGNLRVIVGAGFNSLTETIDFARFCEDQPVEALLVLPPFFDRGAPEPGIIRFFHILADRIRLPIILYNIPQYTGVHISVRMVKELSSMPTIVGVKDSTGDPESLALYVCEFPKLSIFCGADTLALQALKAGASGLITGLGNVFPSEIVRLWMAFQRAEDAQEAQTLVRALVDAFQGLPARAATKYALHLCGLGQTYVRPPEIELTDVQKAQLTKRLA